MRLPLTTPAGMITLAALMSSISLLTAAPSLDLQPGPAADMLTLSGNGSPDGSHRVEMSRGLDDWWPVFAIRDTPAWNWDMDDIDDMQAGLFASSTRPPR